MKYSIHFHRHESKEVQVFADTPDAALKLARESNPGFQACPEVTELLDGDEEGETHVVHATCEYCGAIIWEGQEEKAARIDEDVWACEICKPTRPDADSPVA